MHAGLQGLERRHPLDECDDLAVEQDVREAGEQGQLGIGAGHVVAVAAVRPDLAVLDGDEQADTVPLHLVGPVVAGRQRTRGGEHGDESGGEHHGSVPPESPRTSVITTTTGKGAA